jgi:hypothetical protein
VKIPAIGRKNWLFVASDTTAAGTHQMTLIAEQLLAKAAALPEPPVAFEAQWDGDSSGWGGELNAVLRSEGGYDSRCLAFLRGGGDIRLFNGQVPPWPEAKLAAAVGAELAKRFGVPFYFACPDWPESDTPRWWRRHEATPCACCGVPLLQDDDRCPRRGQCYHCHLSKERDRCA